MRSSIGGDSCRPDEAPQQRLLRSAAVRLALRFRGCRRRRLSSAALRPFAAAALLPRRVPWEGLRGRQLGRSLQAQPRQRQGVLETAQMPWEGA